MEEGSRPTREGEVGIAHFTYMGQGSIYRGISNGCDINCCTGYPQKPCLVDKPYGTVFPQGTAFAASFDAGLAFEAGRVVADESRAMQRHVPTRHFDYRTGASSVVNIARDPRWGRVPETYGECPALTSAIAIAFNRGLMGFSSLDAPDPPPVLKTLPVIRHFAAYAGPESTRFSFDARVSEPDLTLSYLYVWRRLVAAKALAGVMSAISALNGVPGIAHASLLNGRLRGEWGFDGFVVSDCDTFPALMKQWQWAASPEQAAVAALRAGNDINCGAGFAALLNATKLGLLGRADLEASARRALRMRMRVGDLQPPHTDPWWEDAPSLSVVGSAPHAAVLERLVAGGTVLLHHTPGTLPLRGPRLRKVALIGPSAADPSVQAHTYHGTPATWVTVRDALAAELAGTPTTLAFAQGCAIDSADTSGFAGALALADGADAIVYVGGLYARLEEEDTDRTVELQPQGLGLPGVQPALLAKLREAATRRKVPLVVVLVSGGPLAVPELVPPAAGAPDALLWVSYFGQTARPLARILLGTEYPSGRLPFTVPSGGGALPSITNYSMHGRTYRYPAGAPPPLFPFGHGLALGPAWTLSRPSRRRDRSPSPGCARARTRAAPPPARRSRSASSSPRHGARPRRGATECELRAVALRGARVDGGRALALPRRPARRAEQAHARPGRERAGEPGGVRA